MKEKTSIMKKRNTKDEIISAFNSTYIEKTYKSSKTNFGLFSHLIEYRMDALGLPLPTHVPLQVTKTYLRDYYKKNNGDFSNFGNIDMQTKTCCIKKISNILS